MHVAQFHRRARGETCNLAHQRASAVGVDVGRVVVIRRWANFSHARQTLQPLQHLRRVLAEPAATAVASAVFGIWHIRPAAEALAANRLAPGRGARIAAVTAVALAINGGFLGTGSVPALLLFALWTLLTSVHLLRRTWRKPAPVVHTEATVGI